MFNVLWPPANDHLSLSSELLFVPIITIDKIGFCVRLFLSRHKRFTFFFALSALEQYSLHKSSIEAEEMFELDARDFFVNSLLVGT